ncbi:putative nicotinamide N-methyltransferase [Pseudohyphozyma bogoriensis]|nr:putative nicotinamide N-methyltransferase [Pseudohyphozyma bogoriensis]
MVGIYYYLSAIERAPALAKDDDDDPLDLFNDALLSFFDEVLPANGNPSASFTYTPPASASNPAPLTVTIPASQSGLIELQAHYVWNAGIRMANLITTGKVEVKGKNVIELGAGAGIPGLLAAREGAESVVLSDFDNADLLSHIRDNIPSLPPAYQPKVSVVGHTWGTALPPTLPPTSFDLVLLADTLWYTVAHDALLVSLGLLLASTGRIQIVAGRV